MAETGGGTLPDDPGELKRIIRRMEREREREKRRDELERRAAESRLRRRLEQAEIERDVFRELSREMGKGEGPPPTNREKAVVAARLAGEGLPLNRVLRALGLAQSTYRYQLKAMAAPDKYARLRERVAEIFRASGGAYGFRRVHAALRREGTRVSEKVVRRLMAEGGLVARRPKKRRRWSSYAGEIDRAPANLVARRFSADAPDRLWLTDITEFRIPAGKLYLSPVLDCFDGAVVSWAASRRPDAELANTMLRRAVSRLAGDARPVIHSDRGAHYRWPGWVRICREAGLRRSMSRKGCCPDNAAMEGFFGRLKVEFFHGRDWEGVTLDEFEGMLGDYIAWHNDGRIKKSLGYRSPREYREGLGLAI